MSEVAGSPVTDSLDSAEKKFCYLIDARCSFPPYVANISAWELRLRHASNTLRSYLQSLCAVLHVADNFDIDLERRLSELILLRTGEAAKLIGHLCWKFDEGKIAKVKLAKVTHRLIVASSFLWFAYERSMSDMKAANLYSQISKKLERLIHQFVSGVASRAYISESTFSPSSLSKEQLSVIRFVLSPQRDINPFSERFDFTIQYRNAAMVSVLLETGLRPSELCMLESGDVFF